MNVLHLGAVLCLAAISLQSAPESTTAPLYEQIALARHEKEVARAQAPLRDKIAAFFEGKRAKKPRVKKLVELDEAEWQLRKKMLLQQKKNKVQLFVNRHEQELRMALIALVVAAAGGAAIYKTNQAVKSAEQKRLRGAIQSNRVKAKFRDVFLKHHSKSAETKERAARRLQGAQNAEKRRKKLRSISELLDSHFSK